MFPTSVKRFKHPGGVYHLEFPAHWDNVVKEDGRTCGFGPHERDDVGLWISIMPFSIDSDRMAEHLPELMNRAVGQIEASEFRRDHSVRHHCLKADNLKADEGGHFWVIAGGDVILFASSQVPVAERHVWNPPFEKLMASLVITRDDALARRRLEIEVLERLRAQHPDQDFKMDENGIRGANRVVYLGNLFREIQQFPDRREKLIDHFVESLVKSAELSLGQESWLDAKPMLVPVLKPREYIDPNGTTQHLLVNEWLSDVVIVYAIRSTNIFRFVTGWDADRWEVEPSTIHDIAIENLCKLPWPERMVGSSDKKEGRVIVVGTDDSLASSRLLHPDFHRLFSGPLGSPFWAGIPDRGTLVTYSDRKKLKQRIERRLRIDHRTATYPISPRPFLVTPDGIALGRE